MTETRSKDDYVSLKQGGLSDQVVNHLSSLILGGQVAPGEFLPSEPELARRFNVSRTTVREAVGVLESRGLVERRPGVGTIAANRSHETAVLSLGLLLRRNGGGGLRDLLEARLALECLIVELAAARATDDEVKALQKVIEPMGEASSSPDAYLAADLEFHLRLAEASHNLVLFAFVNTIRELLAESIRATYTVDGHTERRYLDHARVLAAVSRRDPMAARIAMMSHLSNAEAVLRQLGLIDNDPPTSHGTR